VVVDNRNEIRQFLASRRGGITPQQAGLPAYGGNRRGAGLRREEVALRAGVSVDYYTRLERGNLGGVSEGVMYVAPVRPANVARFVFLSPPAPAFFPDWERAANDIVANLRTGAGRNPYDRGLSDLVGELSTRSEAFRTRWAAHNVRYHHTGRKRLHHPVIGDLDLTYEVMALPADPGLSLVVYSAEPGSASQDGLELLASWAATLDRLEQAETAQAPDQA
jgi:transcriptional regulator with XRE-family HTH domain